MLTDDHVGPPVLAEHRPILDDILVCSEEDVEFTPQLVLELSARIWRTLV